MGDEPSGRVKGWRSRSLRRLLSFALLLVGPVAAGASEVPRGLTPDKPLSEFVVRRWSTEDGLPTDALLDVKQTEEGYLWLAGFGGVARFNGVTFQVFNRAEVPEFGASSFYEVIEHEGALWIATQNAGVWKYHKGRFEPVVENQRPLSIRTLTFDASGTLLVGTSEEGAFRVRDGRLLPFEHPALADGTVRAILEDADGTVWFGTEGSGLVRLEDGRYEVFTSDEGLSNNSVTSLSSAREGGMWIGTHGGLSRLDGNGISIVEELAGVEVFGLAEDDHGSLWVAAEQGLFRRNGRSGRFEHLESLQGQSLRSLSSLAFDHEGSVWIASYSSGLIQLREGKFKNFGPLDGLGTTRVNSVYETRDGDVLVGGDGGLIQRIEGGQISGFELASPLPSVRIRSFLEDRHGTLWVSSYAGLLRLRGREQTLLTTETGLPTDSVRLVFEDSAGRLWVGTRGGGVVRIRPDGSVAEVLDQASGMMSDYVLALAEDNDGRLLIGTQAGLHVLDRLGAITAYDVDDGLPSNLIFSISVDAEGAAWITTAGGLARFHSDSIGSVSVRNGLPAEAVYDFREDGRGHAWISTGVGLLRVAKMQLEEVLSGQRAMIDADLFDESSGMISRQCTGATRLVMTRSGEVWVPTLGGLAIVDPDALSSNPVAPPVWIDRLSIDGVEVDLAEEGERLSVAPGSQRVDFSFSALSFLVPSRVKVRYRLDGFDDDWVNAGSVRSSLYTELTPGDYNFRVIASNESGVWNREGASFDFEIRPHYYETPQFFALLGLVLLAGPWVVYRRREQGIQKRARHLEHLLAEQRRLERERSRLIRELESRNEQLEHLTYAVSHDLKSPLYTINGFLGMLEKDRAEGNEERFKADLKRIHQATEVMGGLLDQLHRVWSLESAESQFEAIDMNELVSQAVGSLRGTLDQTGVELDIDSRLPAAHGDPIQIEQLWQNLIENAVKFMGDQLEPVIEIGSTGADDDPTFFVRDNGIGIKPDHQDQVFRLFERLDHGRDGTGVGLAIVKRIVAAHGGRVWIRSEGLGHGATFYFTLHPEEV